MLSGWFKAARSFHYYIYEGSINLSCLFSSSIFFFLSLELERQYREETRRIEEQRWVENGFFLKFGPLNLTWLFTNAVEKFLARPLTNSRRMCSFLCKVPFCNFLKTFWSQTNLLVYRGPYVWLYIPIKHFCVLVLSRKCLETQQREAADKLEEARFVNTGKHPNIAFRKHCKVIRKNKINFRKMDKILRKHTVEYLRRMRSILTESFKYHSIFEVMKYVFAVSYFFLTGASLSFSDPSSRGLLKFAAQRKLNEKRSWKRVISS